MLLPPPSSYPEHAMFPGATVTIPEASLSSTEALHSATWEKQTCFPKSGRQLFCSLLPKVFTVKTAVSMLLSKVWLQWLTIKSLWKWMCLLWTFPLPYVLSSEIHRDTLPKVTQLRSSRWLLSIWLQLSEPIEHIPWRVCALKEKSIVDTQVNSYCIIERIEFLSYCNPVR